MIFFFTCTPYVVSLWDGVVGWVSLNDVLAPSLLFMVSVRPTGPLPASRPAGTAESVVASATQRVKWTLTKNKKKINKPVDWFLFFKCWDISYLLFTWHHLWPDRPLFEENCCYRKKSCKNDSCTFMGALHLYMTKDVWLLSIAV